MEPKPTPWPDTSLPVGRRAATRMLVALLVAASGHARAEGSGSAEPFLSAWRNAMSQPGGEAIADLTAFPFLFEGRPLSRPAFVARVVPALFKPAARRCLQHAQPLQEDGRLIVACAPYGYVFGPTPSGWRLIEFFVDTP